MENLLLTRLNEYVNMHLVDLERAYERFMHARLKSSFDINSMSDLNSFVRQPYQPTWLNNANDSIENYDETDETSLNDSDLSNKRVDQCALKIHILLDLLVSDNSISKIFKYDCIGSSLDGFNTIRVITN